MSIAVSGSERVFEALRNRTVSLNNPASEEINFGGSTSGITVYPIARGPIVESVTLTVRISGVGGTYELPYTSRTGTDWINEPKQFPQLPEGRYIVEVHSNSQTEWALLKVGLRYNNGHTTSVTEPPKTIFDLIADFFKNLFPQ